MRHPLIEDRRMAVVSIDPRFLGQLLGAWFRGEIVVNGRRCFLRGLPDDCIFGEANLNPTSWTLDVIVAAPSLEPVSMGERLPVLTLTEFTEEMAVDAR